MDKVEIKLKCEKPESFTIKLSSGKKQKKNKKPNEKSPLRKSSSSSFIGTGEKGKYN